MCSMSAPETDFSSVYWGNVSRGSQTNGSNLKGIK